MHELENQIKHAFRMSADYQHPFHEFFHRIVNIIGDEVEEFDTNGFYQELSGLRKSCKANGSTTLQYLRLVRSLAEQTIKAHQPEQKKTNEIRQTSLFE